MTRGVSKSLPTELPVRFTQGFPWQLDKRCSNARELAADLYRLWTDLGGVESLSTQQLILVERVAYLRRRILDYETAVLNGETPSMDAGTYSNHVNVLLGHLRALGLARRAKAARGLREVMAA